MTRQHRESAVPATHPRLRIPGRVLPLLLLFALAPCARAADFCFVSATPVAFGVYDTNAAAATPGTGQVTVDCQGNKSVAVSIALSAGDSGIYAARRMSSALDTLQYNLYLDAGYAQVFGDGTGGSAMASCVTGVTGGGCTGSNPTGTFRRAVLPFYARIPALQNVASGSYADTLQVTIVF